ncbi:MAG: YigZ family protein [Bacteroidales bacterium]|jgi:uncharacterized YigZ family protein
MDIPDTYKTIRSASQGVFRDRGSRFIAIATPVRSQDEVKLLLDECRKNYHDARHHCYAWMIGYEKDLWRSNDDGEPSGTAGKPILGQIKSNDLTNILIVVIRYFGGTLLGTSGLINAYRSASAEAIKNAEITECLVNSYFRLKFPYSSMNEVMKIIKDEDLLQSEHLFDLTCSMKAGCRLSRTEQVLKRFSAIDNLVFEFLETR